MNRVIVFSALALAAAILIAAACGGDDEADPEGEPNVQEVSVVMSDELRFEPVVVTVQAGLPVALTIDNSANTALHDFSIEMIAVSGVEAEGTSADQGHSGGHGSTTSAPQYDLHAAVDGGEEALLRFIPEEAGDYAFFCSVEGHTEGGMQGTLRVVAS